jgi:uncharacterized protein YlxP (DUF503 family)
MTACVMYLQFEFIDVRSLKGRRSIINSLKEQLKTFNISVLDISSEYPKEAMLAIAFLSPNALMAAKYRQQIETMIEKKFPEWPCEIEYEEI